MSNNINERKKILLVDDDDIQLGIAEFFLKDEYEIYKARSGGEALKYLYNKEFTPNLILLDILMPDIDGWEVFNRIKAISLLKDVSIIFLTSVEEETEKKRAYKMGIADYITKPYNMIELKDRIGKIMKSK
jgi:DNA-binding response OmpR family regulator